MAFLSSLNIGASALTAQRFRMDVISQNITNQDSTRTEAGTPYRRKTVVMEERVDSSFSDILNNNLSGMKPGAGVQISSVEEDQSDFKLVFDPENPDADVDGYVQYPNINTTQEIIDMMSASRSYEASVTAINALKSMAESALQIGR